MLPLGRALKATWKQQLVQHGETRLLSTANHPDIALTLLDQVQVSVLLLISQVLNGHEALTPCGNYIQRGQGNSFPLVPGTGHSPKRALRYGIHH